MTHGHSIKPSVSSLPTELDTFREINSYLERMKSAQQRKAEPGDRELMTRLELDPAPSKARTPVDFQLDLHSISLTPGQVCVLNSTTESPGFCKILSSSHSLFWGPSLFVISAFWLPALWIPGWLNRFLPLGAMNWHIWSQSMYTKTAMLEKPHKRPHRTRNAKRHQLYQAPAL